MDQDADDRRMRLVLPLILLVAAALRAVHLVEIWNTPSFLTPLIDARSYWLWAQRIAGGELIGPDAFFQEPLYPYTLGLLVWLTNTAGEASIRAVAVFQACLGVLSVWLTYAAARRLFDGRLAAYASAALCALYAPYLFFVGLVEKEGLSIPLGLLLLLLLLRARERGPRGYLVAGLLTGLLTLLRGNYLLVLPLLAVAIALDARRAGQSTREWRNAAAIFLVGCLAGILPATLHNALASGAFVPTTSQGGTAFYNCNCRANVTGMGTAAAGVMIRQTPEFEAYDYAREAERRLGLEPLSMTPMESSAYWLGQTFDEILADLPRFFRAERNKLSLVLNAYEAPDNYSLAFEQRFSRALSWNPFRFGLIVPFALAGTWFLLRARRPSSFLLVLAYGYLATLLLFVVTARYRLPATPFLLLLAGYAISRLVQAWRHQRIGPALVPLAFGALLVHGPTGPATDAMRAKDMAARHKNHAITLSEFGDLSGALTEVAAGLALLPGSPDLLSVRAQHLLQTGAPDDRDAAVADLDRVIQKWPEFHHALRIRGMLARLERDNPLAVELLGRARKLRPYEVELSGYYAQALYNTGQHDEAIAELERLVALDPDLAWLRYTLVVMLASQGREAQAQPHAREFLRSGGQPNPEHEALFERVLEP
jgi:tetratricopeptide (TPR) repeat protein